MVFWGEIRYNLSYTLTRKERELNIHIYKKTVLLVVLSLLTACASFDERRYALPTADKFDKEPVNKFLFDIEKEVIILKGKEVKIKGGIINEK